MCTRGKRLTQWQSQRHLNIQLMVHESICLLGSHKNQGALAQSPLLLAISGFQRWSKDISKVWYRGQDICKHGKALPQGR